STPLRLRPAPARRQRRRHLPRPLHLLRQPWATLAPRRLAPQPSSSPSLLASPTSSTWRTARAGPSLRMPGAGNTAECLRPRRVPGPGKPGAALRQLRLRPSTHARCWQHRRVPSSTMCPRGWQTRRDASSTPFSFLAHHFFDTTAPMTNSAPPCACGSTATPSTPATPTRHRPRCSSHGYLDHGYTTLRSRLHRHRHKGLSSA
uniref:Uncharacterized protein n=1 Tax=Aegilops tauschii subsp. strangulata TaxID=200361 RepID=A0A453MJA5_AEGTS